MPTVIYQTFRCAGCGAPVQYHTGDDSYWRRCGGCGHLNPLRDDKPPEVYPGARRKGDHAMGHAR